MDAFLFLGAVLLGLVGMGTAGFCLYLLLSKWMIFKVKICEVGLGMMLVPALPYLLARLLQIIDHFS